MEPDAGQSLTFAMLDALGRAIVTGAYDGRRFPIEAEISEQFGVSRSVTREAVKMLAAKGLLSARPRQGTSVRPSSAWNLFDGDVLRWTLGRKFSIDLLREFSELRLGFEPMAARLAAQRRSPDRIAAIVAGYERMVDAERTGDDFLEADIGFHVALLRATQNAFFMQFEDVVSTALRTSIQFTNRHRGHTASLPQHLAVLSAVRDGKPAEAQAAMVRLIEDVLLVIDDASRGSSGASTFI